jgi:hypothetical protein
MKARWKNDTFMGMSVSAVVTGSSNVGKEWEVLEVQPTGDWRNNLYLLKDFGGPGVHKTVAESHLEVIRDDSSVEQ